MIIIHLYPFVYYSTTIIFICKGIPAGVIIPQAEAGRGIETSD
jgi:hypothetical protein